MKESDKYDLIHYIKDISDEEYNLPMKKLWRRHAPHVSYATFIKYFKIFNKGVR